MPVSVLVKAADAMPGFGIVAAVLGIVITMASISGPIEKIGEKVAAALVGTFGDFHFLRVHEPAGGQHGIHQPRGNHLRPVHCGVGDQFCQRHVAHHGGGNRATRIAERYEAFCRTGLEAMLKALNQPAK